MLVGDAVKQRRERFLRARRAERDYAAQLGRVARVIGEIIKGFAPEGTLEQFYELRQALAKYGELLAPWARKVAARMLEEVSRRDKQAWIEHGHQMGRALAREIEAAPTGKTLREYLAEQVDLITSLPRDAAERVHHLTLRGITQGTRAPDVAREIGETGHVTRSRAMLIARTEVARTASALTMVRAQHVGSTHYIWRTSLDSDVRTLHRKLEGKAIAWDDPPIAGESGERAHAGMIYNCRCWPEPVLPDQI